MSSLSLTHTCFILLIFLHHPYYICTFVCVNKTLKSNFVLQNNALKDFSPLKREKSALIDYTPTLTLFMKRFTFFWIAFILFYNSLNAAVQFDPEMRYRIVCKAERNGCLALGKFHQSPAILFHQTEASIPADAWWYIQPGEKGYTLRNAKTQEYIIYDQERIEDSKKGLSLSIDLEDDYTEWYIEPFRNHFIIKSVKDPSSWFNLRTNGTHLMGTYAGSGSDNELFRIYNINGQEVYSGSGEITPPESQENFIQSFDSLFINGKQPVLDRENQQFFISIPDSVRHDSSLHLYFNYKIKSTSKGKYIKLNDDFISLSENHFKIQSPKCGKKYSLTLVDENGKKVAETHLQFTYLPLVEINLNYCEANYYTRGQIRVTDGNLPGYDSLYHASFKYRGNTSLRYQKKSFNIKLEDNNGYPIDRSFFELRNDNRWILDAMMIDRSCMRNRIGMELWNDFATRPYYADRERKARTGTRGQFVEVFWNGKYHGLYCMSERIDRKQLDIKKFVPRSQSAQGRDEVHGLLYKGKEWGYEVLMGHDQSGEYLPGRPPQRYNNNLGSERWCNYDLKYPDYKTEAVEWKPLYDAVNFVATSTPQQFDREVNRYFDMPVVIDYYLLLDVLLATDNHGKNMYYFAYDYAVPADRKLSLAPWDLDAILGINWESSSTNTTPDWDLDEYIRILEHGQNTLFIKLRQSKQINWKELLAKRYADLRRTYFDKKNLINRVTTYADLFDISKADQREEEKWSGWHEDLQEGAEYIKEWIDKRIDVLDQKYGFDPTILAVNQAISDDYLHINGRQNAIAITCGKAQTVQLYNISGQLVRTQFLTEGENIIESLSPGIYLLGHHKVIVR